MTTRELWLEYVAFLKKKVPASFANLAPGATEKKIAGLEKKLGVKLPDSVKTVWLLNDGQKETMLSDSEAATPCIPTLSFLSTDEVARVWKNWGKVRKNLGEKALRGLDKSHSSATPGVVKALYSSPKWIPLWAHPSEADYIGLDLDPGKKGKRGQIINFGRNEDKHFVFASDFDDLLSFLLEEVRAGSWKKSVFHYGEVKPKKIPWFGDPDKSFWNTLSARWRARNPQPAPKPIPISPARELEKKAAELVDKGELEAAYEAILEARKLAPDIYSMMEAASAIAIKLGRFAEADAHLVALVEESDDDTMNRGTFFLDRIDNLIANLDKRSLALKLMKARLARFPDDEELSEAYAAVKNGAKITREQ